MSDQDHYQKNTKSDKENTEYATTLSGEVRLQKLLAHRGITSRRNAEELIAGGLVTVNGVVETTPGTKVDPQKDVIVVEGRMLPREKETFLFLFYKPKGVISAVFDPDGKPTLKDFFPNISPLLHIGRLDFQTEGVLLLTNNGDLSQRILHPRFAIPRTYLVKIQGGVDPRHLDLIRLGKVRLDGHPVAPIEVEHERTTETNAWYRITLTEGRNREVRRIFETFNYFVLKLTRISFGNLDLKGLEPGEFRVVSSNEIKQLLTPEATYTHNNSQENNARFPNQQKGRESRAEHTPHLKHFGDQKQKSSSAPAIVEIEDPLSAKGNTSPEMEEITVSHNEGETDQRSFSDRPERSSSDRFQPRDRAERPRDGGHSSSSGRFDSDRPKRSFSDRPDRSSSDRFQPRDRAERPRDGGQTSSGEGTRQTKSTYQGSGERTRPHSSNSRPSGRPGQGPGSSRNGKPKTRRS